MKWKQRIWISLFSQMGKKKFLDKIFKKKFLDRYLSNCKKFCIKNLIFLKIGFFKFFFQIYFKKLKSLNEYYCASDEIYNNLICFIEEKLKISKKFSFLCLQKKKNSPKTSPNQFFIFTQKINRLEKDLSLKNQKKFILPMAFLFFSIDFFFDFFSYFLVLLVTKKFVSEISRVKFCFRKRKKILKTKRAPKNNFLKDLKILKKKKSKKFLRFFQKFHPPQNLKEILKGSKIISRKIFSRKLKKIFFIPKNLLLCFYLDFNFFLKESFLGYFKKNYVFRKNQNKENKIFLDFGMNKKNKEKFIRINQKKYLKLELLGKGGSGKVYKIIDENKQILALKKTKIPNREIEALHNCLNEISILKTLVHQPRVIQIKNADISFENGCVLIVLEYGESDLENLIKKKEISDPILLKFFWSHSLEAVQTLHEEKIIHGDLKPSNFLLVKNSLKIIDFGTARLIQKDTTNITRCLRIGTLNYMAPEALVDISNAKGENNRFKLGRSADIWSLGCILFQMVYGNPPFYHLDFVKKIKAITDKSSKIFFLPLNFKFVEDVIKGCLQKNPDFRPSIPELLSHPFLLSDHKYKSTIFKFKNC